MNWTLAQSMSALEQENRTLMDELEASGEIVPADYHPRVRALHQTSARSLAQALDVYGWPDERLVGDEASRAAWRIAMQAVFDVTFMERCRKALREAVGRGAARAWQLAFLEDRIRLMTGRPQRYGTQLEIGADGWPVPWMIEDPDKVDLRRAVMGLEPLAERLGRARGRRQMGLAIQSRGDS